MSLSKYNNCPCANRDYNCTLLSLMKSNYSKLLEIRSSDAVSNHKLFIATSTK